MRGLHFTGRRLSLVLGATLLLSGCEVLFSPEEASGGLDGGKTGAADAAPVDANPDAVTLVFQDGVNDYFGTEDAEINQHLSDSNFGALDEFTWDTKDGNGQDTPTYALLRFNDLIDSGEGTIPPDATIVKATLALSIVDHGELPAGELHDALVDWHEESVKWDTFGVVPGVGSEDYRPASTAPLPYTEGIQTIDVTESVQRWLGGAEENRGWVLVPKDSNGIDAASSESNQKPKLEVTYLPP